MTSEMPMPEPEEIEAMMAESPDAPATPVEGPMATGDDPRVDTITPEGEVLTAVVEPPPPTMEVIVDSTGGMTLEEVTNENVRKKEIEAANVEVRRPSTPLEVSVEEYAEIYNGQIKDLAKLMRETYESAAQNGTPIDEAKHIVADIISKQIHGLMQLISVSKIQWYAAHKTFGMLLKDLDESAAKKYRAKAEGTPRKKPETVMAKSEGKSRKKTPKDPIEAAMATLLDMGYTEEQARAAIANAPKVASGEVK